MIRKKQTIRLFAKDITGDLLKDRQEVTINWRAGQLVMDEPSFNGGKDIGPDPFTTVLSGLVGCTLTTLRMYIKKKGWDITDIHCSVNMLQQTEPFKTSIFRTVSFGQPVTDEQQERLLWVAKNCPVARLLQGEIVIDTHLSDDAAVPAGTGNYPPSDVESSRVPTEPEGFMPSLVERFNSGKLSAMMELYAPEAVFIANDGRTMTDHAEIAARLDLDLKLGLPLVANVRHIFVADDTAQIVVDWSIDGAGPDGDQVHLAGSASDIVRRGADGRWRYLIDNNQGTAVRQPA